VLRILSQPSIVRALESSEKVDISYDVAFPVVVTVFMLYGHPEKLDSRVIVYPVWDAKLVEPSGTDGPNFQSLRFPENSVASIYGLLFTVELTEEDSRNVASEEQPNNAGRLLLYEHFIPIRMYIASGAELHFESRDKKACHFALTAPSSCAWDVGCNQRYQRDLTILQPFSANLFELFMLLDIYDVARMNKRFFASIFDVLFECVSGDVAREAAVNATLEHCSLLLRGHGPRDFSLGVDCLLFVPRPEGQPSYLSRECSHNGVFLCGAEDKWQHCDCYCNTWTWGRSCEFDWHMRVRFSNYNKTLNT
jgi:hypothetical protein